LGIGDWGLGIGDWAQSPIPNPQSPIPMNIFVYLIKINIFEKNDKKGILIFLIKKYKIQKMKYNH